MSWRPRSFRASIVVLVVALSATVLLPSIAQAAVRSGSFTFNPNKPGPTFGNPTPLPTIVFSVSYDDQAGTITVSETGGDPSYFTGWAQFWRLDLSGTNSALVDIEGDWNYPIRPTLHESGVSGTLTPAQFTKSADGTTITAVWSDPALAHQSLTFVTVAPSDSPDNNCFCDVALSGSFYFAGYAPHVVITSPGTQTTRAGTPLGLDVCGGRFGPCCRNPNGTYQPCAGVTIAAGEVGVANGTYGDDPFSPDGTEPPSSLTANGLPPGLMVDGNTVTGTPTTPGTYPVTVTASALYNQQLQTATAATAFTWIITPAPAPPKPVEANSSTMSAAFIASLPSDAKIPSVEGPPCPTVEVKVILEGYAVCFAEYERGGRWHLASGSVEVKHNQLVVTHPYTTSWRRRWTRCSIRSELRQLRVTPIGTLTSNNACGSGAPQSDAYFVGIEMTYAGHFVYGRSGSSAGWQFTDSAGFDSIGRFRCERHGPVEQCTNAVGDSFKYRP